MSLADLSVSEVEELLTQEHDDEGDRVYHKFTYKGYEGAIRESHVCPGSWSYWGEYGDCDVVKPIIIEGLGRVNVKESDTGGEGATKLQIVFQIVDLETGDIRLFAKNGYWVSHDGAYWDGEFDECKAVNKVVTYYEAV